MDDKVMPSEPMPTARSNDRCNITVIQDNSVQITLRGSAFIYSALRSQTFRRHPLLEIAYSQLTHAPRQRTKTKNIFNILSRGFWGGGDVLVNKVFAAEADLDGPHNPADTQIPLYIDFKAGLDRMPVKINLPVGYRMWFTHKNFIAASSGITLSTQRCDSHRQSVARFPNVIMANVKGGETIPGVVVVAGTEKVELVTLYPGQSQRIDQGHVIGGVYKKGHEASLNEITVDATQVFSRESLNEAFEEKRRHATWSRRHQQQRSFGIRPKN